MSAFIYYFLLILDISRALLNKTFWYRYLYKNILPIDITNIFIDCLKKVAMVKVMGI